jgi:hypothetical protein
MKRKVEISNGSASALCWVLERIGLVEEFRDAFPEDAEKIMNAPKQVTREYVADAVIH